MLTLDGSVGEGGGQILRTALSLSLVTGQPFRIHSVRGGRPKPGLLRQHLAAVLAAQSVGAARVTGAELGSRELMFEPTSIRTGSHAFAVGSAGSACLVLQTILPALWSAAEPSTIEVEGGTHNPLAPPFEFLRDTLFPLLGRMGPRLSAELLRPGFYPAGGGKLRVHIEPAKLRSIELLERGELRDLRARSTIAFIPRVVAERELEVIARRLRWPASALSIDEIEHSAGPGNTLSLHLEHEHVTEVITAFGERNVRAETVAQRAVDEARRYLASDAPVGEHLADQLIVPFALSGGGRFRALPLSMHTTTNIEVVQLFLGTSISVTTDPNATQVSFGSARSH